MTDQHVHQVGAEWFDEIRADLAATRAQHGDLLTAFHRVYYATCARTKAWSVWRERVMMKAPTDCLMYAELIQESRPDLIIETGTAHGGSALFMRDMQVIAGAHDGCVATVEMAPEAYPGGPVSQILSGIHTLHGSSTDPIIVTQMRELAAQAERVMVVLDSDHRAQHVWNELQVYAPLVTIGQWLIVEDTNLNAEIALNSADAWRVSDEDYAAITAASADSGHPISYYVPGPREALEAWLPQHPQFRRESYCEHYLLTFNPGGYLMRMA